MRRHEFVAAPQPNECGAIAFCTHCGAKDNDIIMRECTNLVIPNGDNKRQRTDEPITVDMKEIFVEISDGLLEVKLPRTFNLRYSKIGTIPLYIRKSYLKLYELMKTAILTPHPTDLLKCLVTGVPGIGKSMLLLYTMYRFVRDEKLSMLPFAVHISATTYVVFRPISNGLHSMEELSDQRLIDDMTVLVDLVEPKVPLFMGHSTILFSSPDPQRYKEFLKGANTLSLIMPTWDENELMSLYQGKEGSEWYERFVMFGGIPRLISGNPNESEKFVDDAIVSKGAAIIEKFFQDGHGGLNEDTSYKLVHINPPKLDDLSDFDYAGIRIYTFASDIIFQRLTNLNEARIMSKAHQLYDSGISSEIIGGSSAGNYFEKICLWLKPIRGIHVITSLQNSSGLKEPISIPEASELLSSSWKKDRNLQPNIHYKPRISNLISGDSFFVDGSSSGAYRLFILQFTVAAQHPIKVKGLLDILQAFLESLRVAEICLVFVTPLYGKLSTVQRLVSLQEEEVATTLNVAQFVLRYQLST